MRSYRIREYNGVEDLALMQNLVSLTFDVRRDFHTGDIAWQRFEHEIDDSDWPTYLVEENGRLVAWGWLDINSNLVLAVHPSHPKTTGLLVDKLVQVRPNDCLTVDIFESEEHTISGLLDCDFKEAKGEPFHLRMARELDNLPEPNLPYGFRARHIDIKSDLEKRVDIHREVWEPSKVTYRSYRNVINAPTYNPRLDWVIESPDGEFVSYCLIWHDENSGTGLLEPVGTSPRFTRMGLSKAVCTMALRELRKIGGKNAIVNARDDDEHPIPVKLYSSLGFKQIARTRRFTRQT